MVNFQAVVHARQEAKRELSTLRETVRIRAEQRVKERMAQDAVEEELQGDAREPA